MNGHAHRGRDRLVHADVARVLEKHQVVGGPRRDGKRRARYCREAGRRCLELVTASGLGDAQIREGCDAGLQRRVTRVASQDSTVGVHERHADRSGIGRDRVAVGVHHGDSHRGHGSAGRGRCGRLREFQARCRDGRRDADVCGVLGVAAVRLPRGSTLGARLPVVVRAVLQAADWNGGGHSAWRRGAPGGRLACEGSADGLNLDLQTDCAACAVAHDGPHDHTRLGDGSAGRNHRGPIAPQLHEGFDATAPAAPAAASTPCCTEQRVHMTGGGECERKRQAPYLLLAHCLHPLARGPSRTGTHVLYPWPFACRLVAAQLTETLVAPPRQL